MNFRDPKNTHILNQGLGNASFYASHNKLLEEKDRMRVALQIKSILLDAYPKSISMAHVLDLGCSNGVVTNHISSYVKSVVGTDIDQEAIKIANKTYRNKKLSFVVTGGTKTPFHKGTFDIVVCNQVYSYTKYPDNLINEIYRVLKTDGICLFTGDNLLRPIEPLYGIPFLRLLPKSLAFLLLRSLGYKNIYIGNYKTYWGIKNLCSNFKINDYTIKIIKNPRKYHYKNLEKYEVQLRYIPFQILSIMEPFFPSFVFILKK